MGQIYSVAAKLRFNNPLDKEAARQALVRCIKSEIASGSNFGNVRPELYDSFEGVMNIILTNQDFTYNGKDCFSSCFDASYGWESFLADCFHQISPYLTLDSCMTVHPDSGFWIYRASGRYDGIDRDVSPFFDETFSFGFVRFA